MTSAVKLADDGSGDVATGNTAALRADQDRNRAIAERIPAGRWAEPDDISGAVVFRCTARPSARRFSPVCPDRSSAPSSPEIG
ncbi:hypothetical protein OG874_43010 [Nocardia sp. NBC_00565]|uniref:hypothetical protein n=1 Tax=Nocardia sp. NBC_00565 TaxID=2975993 RepID=UPI002E7FEF5C|nr:hypothetical protein [Nocardia sp. NBC_00565]WUC08355.1 hypothetical protein OG874_43010 [Nocardia sp. NBC_00565]